MTTEQFRAEYHLLDRVTDGAVETYHAQAAAGAMVMVHFLRGSAAENAALTTLIERLEPERRRKVLRSVDVDGVTAVVTRFLLDLSSFPEWLQEGARPEPTVAPAAPVGAAEPDFAAPPAGAPAPAPAAAAGPGEFTRLFQSFASPAPGAAAPAPTAEPSRAAEQVRAAGPPSVPHAGLEPAAGPPPPLQAAAGSPGEFTRMFGAATAPSPVSSPPEPASPTPARAAAPLPPAVSPPPAQSPSKQGPGEFTRMFGTATLPSDAAPVAPPSTPVAGPPSSDPAAWPAPAAPAPVPPFAGGPSPALAGLATSPPSSPSQPGEYTRMFGGPTMPPPAPASTSRPADSPLFGSGPAAARPAPPQSAGDSYLERLRGGAHTSAAGPPAGPPPAASPYGAPSYGAPPPAAAGPSEFTRVVAAAPTTGYGSPPPPPRELPKAPPSAPISSRAFVVGIAVVLAAALVFIVLVVALT